MEAYKIPIGDVGEQLVQYIIRDLKPLLAAFGTVILFINGLMKSILFFAPSWVLITFIVALSWWLGSRKAGLFTLTSLLLLWNLRLLEATVTTISLVLTATIFALIIAIPLGILMAESRIVTSLLTPLLDFLQTMPRFIYLIPGIVLFGIGTVPGIIATLTLAIPPPVRLTALGLSQIDKEVIEAGEAFGCNRLKLLYKIKLPLAIPSIMLGINQCIMMSLSMVVIAAMIGTGGLGENIIIAIHRLNTGEGFEAGLGVVVIAIIVDRISKGAVNRRLTRLRGRVMTE